VLETVALDQSAPWCDVHETHSGAVLLVGDLVYKLKKPVDLGFLDFTDRATRMKVCEREVELNRRLAPDVYLGVGALEDPNGDREPVVVMRRMPEDRRLSRLIRSGADVTDDVRAIARAVAAFHLRAATGPEVVAEGTRDALRSRWRANLDQAAALAAGGLDADKVKVVDDLAMSFLDGREELFDDRIARGAIVDGHGDLTPEDVFCLADGPRLLDCLEFDDALRRLDRLDDIAFLAMGLEHLGAPDAAELLVGTWAEHLADPAPPALIHHFVAYRAFVRAKVGAVRGIQRNSSAPEAAAHLDRTLAHLRAGAVTLVLVGGPPGSGKTTLAAAVADRLGMAHVNSDRVRKELAGIDPGTPAASGLFQGTYSSRSTQGTYGEMLRRARLLLGRGESVVLDASWTTEGDRARARELADCMSADVVELRCDLDQATAAKRIAERRHSASDADAAVAAALRAAADPWPTSHPVNTRCTVAESTAEAARRVRPHRQPATFTSPRSDALTGWPN
jgi:uncharacterized protein